jgi:hypothetical protein
MPFDPLEWPSRIKAVERECLALRFAVNYFSNQLVKDHSLLQANLDRRDFRTASELLEGTFIIRLFAEFETGLRQYWTGVRKSQPQVRQLINRIASRCRIPNDDVESVHQVRTYRNYLVHDREGESEPISIRDARHHLCKFLGRMR